MSRDQAVRARRLCFGAGLRSAHISLLFHFLNVVLGNVICRLRDGDLARLARTCRGFTELALDVLWAHPSYGVWNLAQRMPQVLWKVKQVSIGPRDPQSTLVSSLHILRGRALSESNLSRRLHAA
jgi:hypothetical protein